MATKHHERPEVGLEEDLGADQTDRGQPEGQPAVSPASPAGTRTPAARVMMVPTLAYSDGWSW
jgi:hypothetical protein